MISECLYPVIYDDAWVFSTVHVDIVFSDRCRSTSERQIFRTFGFCPLREGGGGLVKIGSGNNLYRLCTCVYACAGGCTGGVGACIRTRV